jgi:hypothetical protein
LPSVERPSLFCLLTTTTTAGVGGGDGAIRQVPGRQPPGDGGPGGLLRRRRAREPGAQPVGHLLRHHPPLPGRLALGLHRRRRFLRAVLGSIYASASRSSAARSGSCSTAARTHSGTATRSSPTTPGSWRSSTGRTSWRFAGGGETVVRVEGRRTSDSDALEFRVHVLSLFRQISSFFISTYYQLA